MTEFASATEFELFEKRWKFVFTCFAVIFAVYKLRDPVRHEGVMGGLDLLDEDLSPGDLDD